MKFNRLLKTPSLKKWQYSIILLPILLTSELLRAKTTYYPEASYDHKFHFVASLGVKNGGDSLIAVVQQETNEIVEKLRVGGFFHGNIGVLIPLGETTDFSIQATVGYLYDEVSSNVTINDRVQLSRATAELIPFYNFGRQRVGVGVMAHFSPEAEFKIGLARETLEFDDAVGGVLQYDIMYDESISAGIRLDYIEYEAFGGALLYEAPTIGIHVTYQF